MVNVPISNPDIDASSQFLMVSVRDCYHQVPNGESQIVEIKEAH